MLSLCNATTVMSTTSPLLEQIRNVHKRERSFGNAGHKNSLSPGVRADPFLVGLLFHLELVYLADRECCKFLPADRPVA